MIRDVKRKLPKKIQYLDEIVKSLDMASLLIANGAKLDLEGEFEDVTPLQILEEHLVPLGLSKSAIESYPIAAISKWKKYILLP